MTVTWIAANPLGQLCRWVYHGAGKDILHGSAELSCTVLSNPLVLQQMPKRVVQVLGDQCTR